MLDPIHLKTLQCVLKHGSFKRAASELGYSPSAVSQQISALERYLGFDLFIRLSKSIEPTNGALFLNQNSRKALKQLDKLEKQVADYRRATSGRLKIGSFGSANARLLPAVIQGVREEAPTAQLLLVQVNPADVFDSLASYEIDVVVNYQYETLDEEISETIENTTLFEEQVFVWLSEQHPLSSAAEVRLEDLSEENWIVAEEATFAPQSLRAFCEQAGFSPKIRFNTNDYHLAVAMVAENLGVAYLPKLSEVPVPGVVVAPIPSLISYRYVVSQNLKTSTNPLIPLFIKHLRLAGRRYSHHP